MLSTFVLSTLAFANEAATAAPAGPPPDMGWVQFVPLFLMLGIFYVLVFRPQQRRLKEQADMQAGLKKGEEVVTASGMFGKVTGVTDKVVTLEVSDNVRIKILKSQVSGVVKGDQPIA